MNLVSQDFSALNSRYTLTCELTSEEGLHIGSGHVGRDTDAPFIREGEEPFLPGSSMRGAMRSLVERFALALFPNRSCTMFVDCDADVCWAGNPDKRKEMEKDTAAMVKAHASGHLRICPVCQLFGSPLMAARLKVGDARQTMAQKRQPVVRDGVGIDRDTETAKAQIKYDFEVLDRGVAFQMQMVLENATPADFALLYILLSEMKRGINVGGKKNRGLGTVQLKSYRVEYFDKALNHGLLDYLSSGPLREEPNMFEGRLKQRFKEFCKESGEVG
jgi:CRISPR-associated RAMP protein (TIGR02581 family)